MTTIFQTQDTVEDSNGQARSRARPRKPQSGRRLNRKILHFELGAGCAGLSRRRTHKLQCIWTDRVSAKMGGWGGGGGGGREREGEEKTGEQHEGNAGKDEAERAARSTEEATHL